MDDVDIQRMRVLPLTTAICVLSTAENVLLHPLWLLKTREQNERTKLTKPWSNGLRIAKNIYSTQGVRGFFPGFVANSVGSGPVYAGYVYAYHATKRELNRSNNDVVRALSPMIAGVAAEMASIMAYLPIDIITQRMALPGQPYKSSLHVATDIYKHEGVRGFYRGFGITAATYGIGSGGWWLAYEHSKRYIQKTFPPVDGSLWNNMSVQAVAGGFAGVTATVMSNPLDVLKTRLQSRPPTPAAAGRQITSGVAGVDIAAAEPYRGVMKGLRSMISNEGYLALTRGLPTRMVQRAPTAALGALVYELCMKAGTVPESLPSNAEWGLSHGWSHLINNDAGASVVSRRSHLPTGSPAVASAPSTSSSSSSSSS